MQDRERSRAQADGTTLYLTDTHCHLDLEGFDDDRADVLQRAEAAGVSRVLVPGLTLDSSRAILPLVDSHQMLFAAIGVHPTEALTWNDGTVEELRALAHQPSPPPLSSRHRTRRPRSAPGAQRRGRSPSGERVSTPADHSAPLAQHPAGTERSGGGGPRKGKGGRERGTKIVAIGEIGLDYYWDRAPHELQRSVLKEQLELAAEADLPVIIHLRESGDADRGPCSEHALEVLESWVAELRASGSTLAERPGVLHSFSGSLETARRAIALGFFIGVSGPVTFKNARNKQGMIAQIPLERLLTETDAPFLAPHPHRGKRNEPAYVAEITDKIAELQSRTREQVAQVTSANAARLFCWGEIA